MSISVLLADDEELIRDGFRLILEDVEDIRVVAEAHDGSQAVELARLHAPDVVLMDIQMPIIDGIEATQRITSELDHPRVVMLTTFERDDYIAASLRAGASGFMLKNVTRPQLLEGIRTVAAGDGILSPTVTRRLIERFAEDGPVDHRVDLVDPLTDREMEVLVAMADGLSNQEIAQRLVLTVGTVKSHVSRVLSKLHLRDRVQAVIFAYETGLIRPGNERRQGELDNTG